MSSLPNTLGHPGIVVSKSDRKNPKFHGTLRVGRNKKMQQKKHRRTGRGGGRGGAAAPPPSLVRNINYTGKRVGQSSCSRFVSLIFLIFSFHLSLAQCIKTHTKTQEMALKRLYFSKFSWRESGKFVSAPTKIPKPVRL